MSIITMFYVTLLYYLSFQFISIRNYTVLGLNILCLIGC